VCAYYDCGGADADCCNTYCLFAAALPADDLTEYSIDGTHTAPDLEE